MHILILILNFFKTLIPNGVKYFYRKEDVDPKLYMITKVTIHYWLTQLNERQTEEAFKSFDCLLESVEKKQLMQIVKRKEKELRNSAHKHLLEIHKIKLTESYYGVMGVMKRHIKEVRREQGLKYYSQYDSDVNYIYPEDIEEVARYAIKGCNKSTILKFHQKISCFILVYKNSLCGQDKPDHESIFDLCQDNVEIYYGDD